MSRRGAISPSYLVDAIDAGRAVLRSLDQDDVPVQLRKVAASSAKRLPPPLLVSLLEYMDDSAWLRDAALETWAEADIEDEDARRAVSALYLARPDGWEETVAARLEGAGDATADHQLAEAQRTITRLERVIAQMEERVTASEYSAASARARTEELFADRIERLEVQRRNAEVAARDAEQRVIEAHGLANALERQLFEADARIEDLRRRARRRERKEPTPHTTGFGRGQPIDVARDLDRMLEAMREGTGEDPDDAGEAPFRLTAGIRPDDPSAFDWLLAQPVPAVVLVDGHNVAHDLESPPRASTRREVEEALVRIRRLAVAPLTVKLFWDSAEAQEQWPVRGLDVRYVPSADDAIVEEAASAGHVVVISTDAEVRSRTQGRGVVALWGTALSAWMRRKS